METVIENFIKDKNNNRGMSLIEVVVGSAILAVILGILVYSINGIFYRQAKVRAKRAVFPLADELKVAVGIELKNMFVGDGRPQTPCLNPIGPLPLRRAGNLPSGIQLKLEDAHSVYAIPVVEAFNKEAIEFCKGNPPSATADPFFPPKTKHSTALVGGILNGFVGPYDLYNQFNFCARIQCPPNPSGTQASRICQYTSDPNFPVLVLFHYVIRGTGTGAPYTCADTKYGWPSDAVGELNYLILWAKPSGNGMEYFTDLGVYHSNRLSK